MKWYGKVFSSVVLFTVLVLMFASASSGKAKMLFQTPTQQPDASTMRTVQVSGMGELQVKPDTAVIDLGVETQATSAQAALQQNNTKTQALMNTLQKANIPAENIQTQTIRLTPRYESAKTGGSQTLVGYTASNIMEVRTKDLKSFGTLLDQAVNAGANTIENISLEVSSPDQMLDQARKLAIVDAQHKAEQLAQLTGATLGPVLEIQESSSAPHPIVGQPAAETAGVPISPGTQNVSVQVQVTWSLVASNQP